MVFRLLYSCYGLHFFRVGCMNKKALSTGIIAVMLALFIFAIVSLITITLWNQFNDSMQNLPEDVASNETKENIDDLGGYILWSDKLFVMIFIVLLVGYLITSVTLPVDRPIFLILFFFLLLFTTIVAMGLSNLWEVFVNDPNLVAALGELPFTDYFMKYLPIIVFFTGIIGAVLFYTRGKQSDTIGGGNPRGFD